MFYLVRIVLKTFLELFPKGKHRRRAILLAAIATVVPLSQLFVIRIFSNLILHGKDEPFEKLIVNFVLFLGLFGVRSQTPLLLEAVFVFLGGGFWVA